jgi:hypothetical protein
MSYHQSMKPATEGPTKPLKPLPETEKKMKGLTRKDFANLLKRAITPHAPKPSPKQT